MDEQKKFDTFGADTLNDCFDSFNSKFDSMPEYSPNYDFRGDKKFSNPTPPIKSEKSIYDELGLPSMPAMPTLYSKPAIESYQPTRLLPDYTSAYSIQNTENQSPNCPLKNNAFDPKNSNFIMNIDAILNPNEDSSSNKGFNMYENPSFRGILSSNKYPSELYYSPIDNMAEDTPFVPPKQTEDNRVQGIRPTQLDWASSTSKSDQRDYDDDEEEEQEPRQLPIHIVKHMPKYQPPVVHMSQNTYNPQHQASNVQSNRLQNSQNSNGYQMQSKSSPPKPM